jgi:hypothetical protein
MPGINSKALISAVASHAAGLGYFDHVTMHEPKNPPGKGLSAAVWVQHIGPARSSGLKSTSALVVMNVRIQTNMLAEPQDEIDPNVMEAVDALIGAYTGDFTLGGLVRAVDLMGMTGQFLRADAGYLSIGGPQGGLYRVMVVQVPLIVNDAWEQAP